MTRVERELRDLCADFAAEGHPVTYAGMSSGSHHVILVRGRKTFLSGTAGDKRAMRNAIGNIRRMLKTLDSGAAVR